MVGYRRFTQVRWDLPRRSSHVAQLWSLGHETVLGFIELIGLAGSSASSQMTMSRYSRVSSGLARARSRGGQVRRIQIDGHFGFI